MRIVDGGTLFFWLVARPLRNRLAIYSINVLDMSEVDSPLPLAERLRLKSAGAATVSDLLAPQATTVTASASVSVDAKATALGCASTSASSAASSASKRPGCSRWWSSEPK